MRSFANTYGQPVSCTGDEAVFQGKGYTVMVIASEPTVRSLVASADVGVTWDALTEQRVCQGFFPPNPKFERVDSNGTYYYATDAGEIEYMPLTNTCQVAFTS